MTQFTRIEHDATGKHNYPKIWICVNGRFVAATTWSRTCREAVERWHKIYGFVSNEKISVNFAKE